MLIVQKTGRLAGAGSLAIVGLMASATALVSAVHPAAAASAFAAIQSAVTCAVTGNNACVSGTNTSTGIGVLGSSKGTTGVGVTGISAGSSGYGVVGRDLTTNGRGVLGSAAKGTAVEADATDGGTGLLANVTGGATGVNVIAATGTGVNVTTAGKFGLLANSTLLSGTGVYGASPQYGVQGEHLSSSHLGAGVLGDANLGYGVLGNATGSQTIGVGASSPYIALLGTTANGQGLVASSQTGIGVNATSNSSVALQAVSTSGAAINAVSSSGVVAIYGNAPDGNGAEISGSNIGLVGRSNNFPLWLSDLSGHEVFHVDQEGNVFYGGGLVSENAAFGRGTVTAYSSKLTVPTVEDTGTAQLVGSQATVRLDPVYAAAVDLGSGYRVFITANGETHGSLYVPQKTANGFVVRETQGGRSSVSFDYRIVATALGQTGKRMTLTYGPRPGATSAPVLALPIKPVIAPPALPLNAEQSAKP